VLQVSIRRDRSERQNITLRRSDDAGHALRSRSEHVAFEEMVLAQGVGDANRQAPRDEEGDRGGKCELTSSIVPRGTSFRRAVELGLLPVDCSCCCHGFPGPAEFGAIKCGAWSRPIDGPASGYVDGGALGQRHHRADTGGRYQAPTYFIVPHDGEQAAMQNGELLASTRRTTSSGSTSIARSGPAP
jgi:hypothetical protein